MEGTKSFLASKTFWGALIAVIASLGGLFNFSLPIEGLSDEIVALVGAALALYGRFAAKKSLTIT